MKPLVKPALHCGCGCGYGKGHKLDIAAKGINLGLGAAIKGVELAKVAAEAAKAGVELGKVVKDPLIDLIKIPISGVKGKVKPHKIPVNPYPVYPHEVPEKPWLKIPMELGKISKGLVKEKAMTGLGLINAIKSPIKAAKGLGKPCIPGQPCIPGETCIPVPEEPCIPVPWHP